MKIEIYKIKRGVGIAVLAAGLTASAFGQATSGNVTGNVYDPTGATIPNAEMTATNVATGVTSTTHSTSAGQYHFENLPVGEYTITASAPGFAKATLKNLQVQLNVTVTANVTETVGQTATSVEVTESAVTIDTTTAQIQNTFDSKQIADLPVTSTGSGVLNLSLYSAGVASSGSVGSGTGPSVAGQRPRNNNFMVEGIDNNSGSVTGPLVTVPNDAVDQFSVLQNQFSPDFGHSSGGQFNTIVKSGTNQFHGEAYEYNQNRNYDAADNLAAVDGTPLHPRYDNNRFGGNFSGPIIHNKLFFFGDYEYNPVGEAGSAGLLFAPTSAGYSALAAIPGVNQTNLSILQKYLPATSAASDPSATFSGAYPVVNGVTIPVGQLSVATPSYSNNEAGVAAVDYNISDKDSLRGRFVLNRSGSIDTSASLPVFFETVPTNNYLATFSEYHDFSATLINEFRFGYNRNSNTFSSGNFTFPGLDQFPNLQFNDLGVQLGPDPNAPQFGYQNIYQGTDNLTWSKGAHTFKMGFDGIRNISPQAFTQRSRGDYEYNSVASYLTDQVPDYLAQRSQGDPIYWGNRWLWGFYVNDTWKIRPNLTVNLGVRYEYDTVPAAENSQVLNAVASVPGLITFGKPQAQTNNIMPRIGIAYSPGTDGKTSIRAGFGINYDVLFDNLGLLTLPPELSTTVDVTGNPGSGFLANGGIAPTGPSATYSASDARASTSGFVPTVKRPESYQWNFGIEHEFAHNYLFETRYIGTRGLYLDVQDQLNRAPVVNGSNAIPVFFTMPSLATLSGLTNNYGTLATAYANGGDTLASFANAGFTSPITSYQPYGSSTYHGWANQLTRRLSNGLQFVGAYTWSHAIDNSTADVFSTYSTPRRPQDSQNLSADRSSSALDHRNRFTFEMIYDVPYFKHSNWLLKNVVGNWELAPIYTYQTGTLYTVLAGTDANLNGDSAPDRAIVNTAGSQNVGTGTTPYNSLGQVVPAGDPSIVAYVANNSNAGYVATPKGALSNAGRNTGMLLPIDNIDVSVVKRFTFRERFNLQLTAQMFNVLNHSQYTGGFLNDVAPNGATSVAQLEVFQANSSIFNQPSQAFSSNPRSMVLTAKITF
jgi:hypothetical protein